MEGAPVDLRREWCADLERWRGWKGDVWVVPRWGDVREGSGGEGEGGSWGKERLAKAEAGCVSIDGGIEAMGAPTVCDR